MTAAVAPHERASRPRGPSCRPLASKTRIWDYVTRRHAISSPQILAKSPVSSGGRHSCGMRTDGTVTCWGANVMAQSTVPATPFRTVSVGDLAYGRAHVCGLRADGSVSCFGEDSVDQASPPEDHFLSVSAGYRFTCGVRLDGTIVCWGDNYSGKATPPEGTFSMVSAGHDWACGIKSDGIAVCWGGGWNGTNCLVR